MNLTTRTLGDICDEVSGIIRTGPFGSQLHESDYTTQGIPVVMPKNIVDGRVSVDDIAYIGKNDVARLSQHELQEGDIVYGRRGDIGRRALVTKREKGWLCGTGCLRISLGKNILDPHFLFYFLGQPDVVAWIANQAIGATLPNLNTAIIRSITVTYPPLPTQQKIAAILSSYDDLIENNTRRIAILEEMAQSLYREWFVHFRFPDHEKNSMVESELGEIPAGWEVKAFSKVADFVNGFAFKPDDWGRVGMPIVKIAELKNGVTDKTPFHNGSSIPSKYHIQNGDLLFSWSADLDAYIWSGGSALLNQHLFNVVPFEDFTRAFVFYSLKERMWDFRSKSQGTTMKHIKRVALEQVHLIVPPKGLRVQFEEYANTMLLEVINLVNKNANLRRTRDLLLPRLISGELDVEHVEIAMGNEENVAERV